MSNNYTKLHPFAFALSLGVVWGLGVLILALMVSLYDWGTMFLQVLASVYIGLAANLQGALIGALWGFADAFIGGLIFALLYNCVSYCGSYCSRKKD